MIKSKFWPHFEYDDLPRDLKESGYISPNGDTLEASLDIRHAAVAFFNIIYRYVNSPTRADSIRITDEYDRTDGNTGWGEMRCARNLPVAHVRRDLRPPTVSDILERETSRLVELSDALAVLAIEQNAEVAMNPSSLGALWKKLGHPNPVNAAQWVIQQQIYPGGCWFRACGSAMGLRSKGAIVISL